MKFKVVTLGCKVNTYESVFMKEKLIEAGYLEGEPADIIIINTCSVTNMADNKSKKVIRHEKRNNPEAIIVVCGCSAENNREKLSDLGINILIGNKDKNKIVALIKEYLDNKKLPGSITFDEKIDMMERHLNSLVKDRGEKGAVLEIRGHILNYLKYLTENKEIKNAICKCNNSNDIINILEEYRSNLKKI